MSDYRLGKRPAVRPHALASLDEYIMGRPPQPPAACPPPQIANWGMFANGPDPTCDVPGAPFGDCVIAGSAHAIMAVNSALGTADKVPDSDQAVHEYFMETGGVDSGLNVADHLAKWHQYGIFADDGSANLLPAYAPVSNGSILALHRAIWLCRDCKMGWQLPETAEAQIRAGEPFTVVPGAEIIGGHDMEAVGYDDQWVYLVTWGQLQPASYAFVETYCDEAFALLMQAVKERGFGPTQIDFASLEADLDKLAA